MLTTILDLIGLVIAGLYLYVMIAMIVTDRKAGMSWGAALSRSIVWPLTIWQSINRLHEAPPPSTVRRRQGSER